MNLANGAQHVFNIAKLTPSYIFWSSNVVVDDVRYMTQERPI